MTFFLLGHQLFNPHLHLTFITFAITIGKKPKIWRNKGWLQLTKPCPLPLPHSLLLPYTFSPIFLLITNLCFCLSHPLSHYTSNQKLRLGCGCIKWSALDRQCSPWADRDGPLDVGRTTLAGLAICRRCGGSSGSSRRWQGRDGHTLAWRAHGEGCGRAHLHVELWWKLECSKLLHFLLQPPVVFC